MNRKMALNHGSKRKTEGLADLAVIIVNWNVRDLLLENIRKLLEANKDARFELIVIDNASSDGSVDAVKEAFPNIHVIENTTNRGFAAAVNQGLRESRARHALLLNPDMRVEPGVLKKLVNFLDAHSNIGVLSGKLLDENGKAMHHMRRFPTFASQLAVVLKLPHLFPHLLDRYYGKGLDLEKEQSVDSVRGSFFAISQTALAKIGHFDERYFIWFEEVDYCRRVKEARLDVRYVPGLVAHDLIGKSFAKRNVYWKQKHFTASMIHYFEKWHPGWQSLLLQIARVPVLSLARAYDRFLSSRPKQSGVKGSLIKQKRDSSVSFHSGRNEGEGPKLAIQIVLYKSSEDLPALLDSLKAQSFRDFAVFFYHNFYSFAETQQCQKLIEASSLNAHTFAAEQNIGFAGGHMALYNLHQAPFVLLLNDDTRLASNYLEILMRSMESNEQIAASSGLIYRWDEQTIDTAGLEYKCLAQIVDRFSGQELTVDSQKLEPGEIFGVSGAVGLYRRSAVEKSGGLFDPSWFMYKEDVDLALRLRDAGYIAWFDPKAVGYHKRGLKQVSGLLARWRDERKRPIKLRVYAYANQLRMYKRHWRRMNAKDVLRSACIEFIRSTGTLIASPKVFFSAWKVVWKS